MMAPDPTLVRADISPILIYLGIVIIWAIAKKLQGLAKGGTTPPAEQPGRSDRPEQPARRRPNIDPALQEFLETLTGQKLDTAPRPEARPPLPPTPRPEQVLMPPQPQPSVVRRPEPRVVAAPQPRPERTVHTPGRLEPSRVHAEHSATKRHSKPEKAIVAPHVDQPVLGAASSLAALRSPRMPMPSLHLPTTRLDVDHRISINLDTRHAQRRAMIERVILGKPRAMGVDPEERQMGW